MNDDSRGDTLCYCPRTDQEVLILSSVCFWNGNREACGGCLFNTEHIKAKLLVLLSDILNRKARAGATDISEIGTVKFSTVNESNPTMCPKTGEVN
jgi:hypothetical protein